MISEADLEEIIEEVSVAYSEGAFELALTLCEKGLSHAPNTSQLLHIRGLLFFRSGELQNATDSIRRAIVEDPSHADYHNSLGVALKKSGRVSESIGAYQTFVWADKFSLIGGDQVRVQTQASANVDVWYNYIDQSWV